jgi:Zn-dependent protease with chaperone function
VSLLVLCVAALALVAYALSGSLVFALHVLRRPFARLAPAAQARLYLLAALVPALVSVAVLIAALAPNFGWIADHCTVLGDPHTHPHICADHHVSAWPAIPLALLTLMVLLRCAWVVAGRFYALILAFKAHRSLQKASTPDVQPGVRVLPFPDAQGFVLGLFRPTIYLTQGLVSGRQRQHLAAVLAHERAHLNRYDHWRRFFAGLGLAMHLPILGAWVERRLARAQEMAADEAAAQAVGSAESIAEALVALAKDQAGIPVSEWAHSGLAFSGTEIESRVLQLMNGKRGHDWPKLSGLMLGAVIVLATLAATAGEVHHGIEQLLGIIGG